jgi:hypothetical protein
VIDRGETGSFVFEDWMIARSGTTARDQARRSRISDVAGNRHSPRLVTTLSVDAAAINGLFGNWRDRRRPGFLRRASGH